MTPISLPIALRVAGQPIALVGEGEGAQAKARLLDARAADVRYHGTEAELIERYGVTSLAEAINGARAVFVASDDADLIEAARELAAQRGVLINVMDQPAACQFTVPAIVDRGPIQISIATDGVSPVLARLLRGRIEQVLPAGFERLASLAKRWQAPVREAIDGLSNRRRFWERLLTGAIAQQAMQGEDVDAKVQAELDSLDTPSGEVYLVGAGPGDAELLTLKGLRLLQQADIVLYDALVSPEVLELARRDAVLEDVGKRRGRCPMPQEAIIERILFWARQGRRVCRLKGGDPYLFGRGGEEALAVAGDGIPFQVVPGITSASGIAAQAGIPLTHRGIARSVRFATGHLANGSLPTDFSRLVDQQETLVLYMALHHMPAIQATLIGADVAPNTPVAFIQNGARPNQQVWRTTLEQAADVAAKIDPEQGPTLIILGEVVNLAQHLAGNTLADEVAGSWIQAAPVGAS